MSTTISEEHWFDRLAAPQTRRQLLKTTLAAAALTLPFARSATATAADDPHACQTGCLYTAHTKFLRQLDACSSATKLQVKVVTGGAIFFGGFYAVLAVGADAAAAIQHDACVEVALLRQKASMHDCLQPDCPGFDKNAPGGPCESCNTVRGASCCPDQSVVTGYSCCAQCCSKTGSGCGSGVTDCGGG